MITFDGYRILIFFLKIDKEKQIFILPFLFKLYLRVHEHLIRKGFFHGINQTHNYRWSNMRIWAFAFLNDNVTKTIIWKTDGNVIREWSNLNQMINLYSEKERESTWCASWVDAIRSLWPRLRSLLFKNLNLYLTRTQDRTNTLQEIKI